VGSIYETWAHAERSLGDLGRARDRLSKAIELYEQTPETLAGVVCKGSPVYVFVERENIESQWAGKAPAANFLWLVNEAGMEELGEEGTWSLYQVGCGRG